MLQPDEQVTERKEPVTKAWLLQPASSPLLSSLQPASSPLLSSLLLV